MGYVSITNTIDVERNVAQNAQRKIRITAEKQLPAIIGSFPVAAWIPACNTRNRERERERERDKNGRSLVCSILTGDFEEAIPRPRPSF